MSNPKPLRTLDPARRRRLSLVDRLSAVSTATLGLVALYYLAPLHKLGGGSAG